jgi:hypothetical protein
VGIGTTSPDVKLYVQGDTGVRVNSTSNASHVELEHTGSGVYTLGTYNYSEGGNIGGVLAFATNINQSNAHTERMRIDSSGKVGIGTSSPSAELSVSNSGAAGYEVSPATVIGNTIRQLAFNRSTSAYIPLRTQASEHQFYVSSSERMRIDSSGNLLVGKTSSSLDVEGTAIFPTFARFTRAGAPAVQMNRKTSDGDILDFRKDGTTVGSIGTNGGSRLYIASGDTGLDFEASNDAIRPCSGSGGSRDNVIDLGRPDVRFDDIYATNGTIQTSDRNEKQDIAELSDAEQRVAVACKGLLRKFRWKDSVAEKGDEARTHFGIIAQDLQAAFAAEGLDAGDYAMFISTTWTDEETNEEKTRMGVRYSELLAFIIAAI